MCELAPARSADLNAHDTCPLSQKALCQGWETQREVGRKPAEVAGAHGLPASCPRGPGEPLLRAGLPGDPMMPSSLLVP